MIGSIIGTDLTSAIAAWAVDTALYTGMLIAAVLVLRRPVARFFGPRTAYALWLLPLARFALPPIVLPAWLRPADPAVADISSVVVGAYPVMNPALADAPVAQPLISAAMLADAAIAVWLVGAILFLGWRLACYRAMTRHLLAHSRPVGDFGAIRLVESAAVAAPIAFGVRNRVIALPPGFMASADVAARDLAIAHEIAHHRGHDLIANFAAQPVLALHWCNPVAWLGWRAMRRDQEAACDARVMTGRTMEDRVRYGEVIAACSREQNLAPTLMLAAPMAGFREIGPVLGEKAIVHRLRSLGMKTTTRRHRMGLLLVGVAGIAALSTTASISYAEADPVGPTSTAATTTSVVARTSVSPSAAVDPVHAVSGTEAAGTETRTHLLIKAGEGEDFEWHSHADEVSPEEMARIDREMARAEAEMGRAHANMERAHKSMALAFVTAPEVEEEVSGNGKVRTIRIFKRTDNGKRELVQETIVDEAKIERDAMQGAIRGIERARAALADNKALTAEVRAEVLAELDAELAELRAELAGQR
ncbi:hypothetical protein EKN06_04660 [Croceicoccus ponticola]|uniref:Peptidase M56 domain-containing protein n=1 Tax=Croceicoccus ponticola TaxID=2217664 RepID=A0A437H1L0_9SPHN|nr:M56 family metallopeptidase [Croceicoccus ponticola]RVQ69469.1 hypothetical protein EKN06_04660 [Croceicoccus ponticola]